MIVTVITEDGQEQMSYKDFLSNKKLFDMTHDQSRYLLVLGNTLLTFDKKYLADNDQARQLVAMLENERHKNGLQFFAPSGSAITDFINDSYNTITGIIAPNRNGKTVSAIVKWLIRSIECKKDWKIFSEHGIEWQPYYGPKEVGIATYQWAQHKRVIWPELSRWIPREELGNYAKNSLKQKYINWDRNPCIQLESGTNIWFYCYEQDQNQFEGQALDIWHWDEQGEEDKFDGANERTRTRRNGQHIFSLTPHKIPGRPDTGSGSWIHKLDSGEVTKGHRVKMYHSSLEDVPDWIYSEEQKRAAYKQWIEEPSAANNIKKLREGQARYYGKWHESAGLVYDDWNRQVHVIEPFTIPKSWTKYRAIDHGYTNPTGCLWGAVDPDGNLFIYREYYKNLCVISENCKAIIEASGNIRKKEGVEVNVKAGTTYDRYIEIQKAESFYRTVFDSRSFTYPDASYGMPISRVYNINGLRLSQASGKNSEDSIPYVMEYFKIDQERKHYVTKQFGAPKCYVFSTLKHFISEIEHYVYEERRSKLGFEVNAKERPREKEDHLLDCIRYMIQIPPRYVDGYGDNSVDEDTDNVVKYNNRDIVTGY